MLARTECWGREEKVRRNRVTVRSNLRQKGVPFWTEGPLASSSKGFLFARQRVLSPLTVAVLRIGLALRFVTACRQFPPQAPPVS